MKTTPTKISKTEKILFLSFSMLCLGCIVFLIFYHTKDIIFYETEGGCAMKLLFHLYCPGCGGTRAIDAFLHGQLITSFLYNPVILYLACYFLSYYIPATLRIAGIWKQKLNGMVYVYILIGLLAVIIIHFIVRNLLLVFGGIDYIGECIQYWQ